MKTRKDKSFYLIVFSWLLFHATGVVVEVEVEVDMGVVETDAETITEMAEVLVQIEIIMVETALARTEVQRSNLCTKNCGWNALLYSVRGVCSDTGDKEVGCPFTLSNAPFLLV